MLVLILHAAALPGRRFGQLISGQAEVPAAEAASLRKCEFKGCVDILEDVSADNGCWPSPGFPETGTVERVTKKNVEDGGEAAHMSTRTRTLLHARTPDASPRHPDASLHALPAGVTTLMIGISTIGWMAGTGKGPDLFVAWHGGGVFMLRNEGQGRFTPHLTPTCRPDSFRPSRNAHNDEAMLWTPDCSDETGALNRDCLHSSNSSGGDQLGTEMVHVTSDLFSPEVDCVPGSDYHQVVIADLDNDGGQEVFRAVGGSQGMMICDGPTLDQCTFPNSTVEETKSRYEQMANRTINAIYRRVGNVIVGGQRAGEATGAGGYGARGHVPVVADFNQDGLLDLLIGNHVDKAFPRGTHPSRLWLQHKCAHGKSPVPTVVSRCMPAPSHCV